MPVREITIINKLGLHARATSKLVSLAKSFASTVELENATTRVDAKRIMSVMLLGAGQHSILTLITEGADADAAMAAMCELIENRFGEDE